MNKIGFACKYSEIHPKNGVISVPEYNTKTTTVSWLKKQTKSAAYDKLWELMIYNLSATTNVIKKIGQLDESIRLFRISSDLLPVYTHMDFMHFYHQQDVQDYASRHFSAMGLLARDSAVRLSFHPGQYNSISSDRDSVVANTLADLEYHADMARWMGFGQSKLDFKINVHLSGKNGIDGFDNAWNKMSPELKNCLTLENDEYQASIDDLLQLSDKVGIVLDIHHHLIMTGEYIQPDDERIPQIIDSWCGVTPTIHYSQSRHEYISQFLDKMPTMEEMLSVASKSKLRSHSDFYLNQHINKWALQHLSWAHIMAECKAKNIAVEHLIKTSARH